MSLQVGQTVQIATKRSQMTRYNGLCGEVVSISIAGLAYIYIDNLMRCFYLDELEAIASPTVGGEV